MTQQTVPRQRDTKGRFVRRGARLGGSPNRRYQIRRNSNNSTEPIQNRDEPDPYPPRSLVGRRRIGGTTVDSKSADKPTYRPTGVIDGFTGRSFVYDDDNKSGGTDNNNNGWRHRRSDNWRIVATGGGGRPIRLSALIRPSTSELKIFATDITIPSGMPFNGDRFEWRPTYADQHAAVLKRIQTTRKTGGSTILNGPAVKSALSDIQLAAGRLIIGNDAAIKPISTRKTDRLCAGYAVSNGLAVGALTVDASGKASWIGARGRVSLSDARRCAGTGDIIELSAPPPAVLALGRCRSGVEPAAFLALLGCKL